MSVPSVPASRRPCGFHLHLYAERPEHLRGYIEAFPGACVDVAECDHGIYQATFAGQRWEVAGLLAKLRAETAAHVWKALVPVVRTNFNLLVWTAPEGVYQNPRLRF